MAKEGTICLILLAALGCEKPAPTPAPRPPAESSKRAQAGPRRVIDVHAHMSPVVYRLVPKIASTNGIARFVNLSGGFGVERVAKHVEAANQLGQKVALFSNIDWEGIDQEGFGAARAQDLRRYVALGTAGLKISKHLGLGAARGDTLVAVDDPELDPIWTMAGKLGIVVSIHTSDPKAFFEPPDSDNERWAELSEAPGWSFYGVQWPSREALLQARDRVVKRHPKTTFVLVHVANSPEDLDYVDRLLDTYPNAYIDLAARIGEIGRHDADKVRAFFVKHRKRILFGTDIMLSAQRAAGGVYLSLTLGSLSKEPPDLDDIKPFYDSHWRYLEESGEPIDHPVPIQGDWKVNPIGLPPDVLEDVYYKNAERLIFAPHFGRQMAFQVARVALNQTERSRALPTSPESRAE